MSKLDAYVAGRLEELTRCVREIASGDFKSPARVTPAMDEFDAVAVGLNMLSDELATRFTETKYVRRRVDGLIQVLERAAGGNLAARVTHEGKKDAFDSLADGINTMLGEISETMDQMNRFQEITIDREMVMIGLKAEINSLLARLGLSPKYDAPCKSRAKKS